MDKEFHAQLHDLRSRPCNKKCADCDDIPTQWASVNLGIFICTDCAQIHRGIGTHISKVKSCMGSYNWHPDELKNMYILGNKKVNLKYETDLDMLKPTKSASTDYKKEYILKNIHKNLIKYLNNN